MNRIILENIIYLKCDTSVFVCLFVLLFPIFLWLAQITTIFNAVITITKFNKPFILKFKRINIGILCFSCVVYEIILTRLLRSLKRKLIKNILENYVMGSSRYIALE